MILCYYHVVMFVAPKCYIESISHSIYKPRDMNGSASTLFFI